MCIKDSYPRYRFGDGPFRGRFHLREKRRPLALDPLDQMMVIVRDITVSAMIMDRAGTT